MSWRFLLLCLLAAAFGTGAAPAWGRNLAVVVGVDDYQDRGIPDLQVAVADARRLGAVLKQDCGFDVVLELYDNHAALEQLPTHANMSEAIRKTLLAAKAGDTVLIFFSGHGFNDAEGNSYLLPQNCDAQNPGIFGYRASELVSLIKLCPATQKVLILDCCHAGGAGAAGPARENVAKAFAAVPNLVTLASCEQQEESQQWVGMGQSVYTFHLLRGLEGAADANRDGTIDTQELQAYLQPRVSRTARSLGRSSQTCVKFPANETRPLALVAPRGFTNVLGMRLLRISAGRFAMGSPAAEDGNLDEMLHDETIEQGFFLGEKEVTQAEFSAIMGRNPSRFFGAGGAGEFGPAERRPVDSVSYADAEEFCRKLAESPQEREAGRAYRLPTEKEWEYACRAGTQTAVSVGNQLSSSQANFDGNHPWPSGGQTGPDRNTTIPGGSFAANAWGLFDMHGNVWEWCSDWLVPQERRDRVIRGGGWDSNGYSCRAAFRGGYRPQRGRNDIGFRVVAEFQSGKQENAP